MYKILMFFFLLYPIVTRHDVNPKRHLVNPNQFPNVIQLKLMDATGWVEMEGTFIKKDWIITAAHGLTSVEAGQNIYLFKKNYQVSKIILHPDWDGANNDIALIQLEEEVKNINPAKLYQDSKEINKDIIIVGRGWYGTGQSGPSIDDKKLRMATNRIDSVSTNWIKFRFDAPGDKNVTALEGISGPGDSGGPAFLQINKQQYLAGISSHQISAPLGLQEGTYGVIEYYSRVSNYIPWIEGVVSGNYKRTDLKDSVTQNKWGFPTTSIGEKATIIMDAMFNKKVNKQLVDDVFTKSFRKSTDLYSFLKTGAEILNHPVIKEIKTIKKHVIRFTVLSEGKIYYIQFDAEKRNDYLISGMIIKKIKK